jgi:hypothetical protein
MDERQKPTRRDREPGSADHTEKDPQGWSLGPVPGEDLEYIDMMNRRGGYDSVVTGMSMRRLQEHLRPKSKLVIVGQETQGQSSFIELVTSVAQAEREYGGRLPGAQERDPYLFATFSDIPTPEELNEFLVRNSREAGYMQGWSRGEVPYAVLYADTPGAIEFGTMNPWSQTRTQAGRSYED